MFIYSICYYYGKNKKSNLYNHIQQFNNLTDVEDKRFIMVIMVDDLNQSDQIKEEFSNIISQNCPDFDIITCYNWGGTIVALWLIHKYIENTLPDDTLVTLFEEDFGPKDSSWFNDAMTKLEDDIIYVGETTTGKIKRENDDGRKTGAQHRNTHMFGHPEVWTDGGFYFTTSNRLKIIEEKIGIFHKGNHETKYSNQIDGIAFGEVGFPTQLNNVGLKFTPLYRHDYFINEW